MNYQKDIKRRYSTHIILAVPGIIILVIFIVFAAFSHDLKWELGKTKFSVVYESTAGWGQPIKTDIKVNENGDFEHIVYNITDFNNPRVTSKFIGKLTSNQMEELFNYMMNDARFFTIKKYISLDGISDSGVQYLKVGYNGKTYCIGGYAARYYPPFSKVCQKLLEIDNRLVGNK